MSGQPIKSTNQILNELTGATCGLVVDEPFYGHFFSGMLKEVHDRVKTMSVGAVGNHVKLHINPGFWSQQLTSIELRKGLIKHELLHVVFKHIFRTQSVKRKDIYNIAADMVVNQYIRVGRLPESHINLAMFPELKLKSEMAAEYYYHKLLELYEEMNGQENEAQGGKEKPAGGENTEQPEKGKQEHKASGGKEKPEEQDQNSENNADSIPEDPKPENQSWENLKDLLQEENEWQAKHDSWNEIDQMPKAMQEVLQGAVDQAISNTIQRAKVKGWGKLPARLQEFLKDFDRARASEINWKRVLRLFTERSSKTFIRNTVRRPSKRYGTSPGIKIKRRQKLMLVIDTSGSIQQSELKIFFNEVYHIWKRGAEILIVECDLEIGATYTYKGQTPESIKGRGGTDFNPPIRYANLKYHPDAIIYFTDGMAETPTTKPRYPILWVIKGNGISEKSERFQKLPGKKIKLKNSTDQQTNSGKQAV